MDPPGKPSYNAEPVPHPRDRNDPAAIRLGKPHRARDPVAQAFPLRIIGRFLTTRFFGKSVRTPNMTSKLPTLTLAGFLSAGLTVSTAVAQVDSPVSGAYANSQRVPPDRGKAPQRRGQDLLEQAVFALESRQSVSAKIRQSVDLFGKKLFGSGVYLEQRSDRQTLLRLEIKIQLGDRSSNLLEVCDGRYLWIYRKLRGEGALGRIDVLRIVRALEESGQIPGTEAMENWRGIGGLPKLLTGLDAAFAFDSVEETQLAGQLPVWRLEGSWKQDRLTRVLPKQEGTVKEDTPPDLTRLPDHLPDHVVLFLGKDDLFPYRIEYRRRKAKGQAGRDAPEDRPIVVMDLFQVSFNCPIHPTRFIYNPGDHEFSDQTDDFLKKLGLQK